MTEALQTFLQAYHDGTEIRAFDFLGCHAESRSDVPGYVFRVWAPNAQAVSVVGDFNFWNPEDLPMEKISQGVWEAWSPNPKEGCPYKFLVRHWDGRRTLPASSATRAPTAGTTPSGSSAAPPGPRWTAR